MATRSKPYPLWLAIVDVILLLATAGGWLVVVAVREMYRFFGPRKNR